MMDEGLRVGNEKNRHFKPKDMDKRMVMERNRIWATIEEGTRLHYGAGLGGRLQSMGSSINSPAIVDVPLYAPIHLYTPIKKNGNPERIMSYPVQ